MKHDMIPCDEVMRRLWAFIDGELEPDSEDEVRRHLEVCQLCYPRYDFQQAYFRLVRRLADRPVPTGLRSRVFEALLAETA